MSTRRENAIKKIKKLEGQLDYTTTERGVESRTREICRLQQKYNITDDDVKSKGKYVVIDNVAVWKPGKWRI